MHDLCAGLVLFRLRSKELSPVCTGIAILFVDCHRSDNQFQETPKHDLASFCAQWTQKRGPKPLQNLRGAANLQSKNLGFLGLNKIRMRSLVLRERKNKTLPQVLGLCVSPNFRYSSKCNAEIYRAQYENAILVYLRGTPIWRPENSVNFGFLGD